MGKLSLVMIKHFLQPTLMLLMKMDPWSNSNILIKFWDIFSHCSRNPSWFENMLFVGESLYCVKSKEEKLIRTMKIMFQDKKLDIYHRKGHYMKIKWRTRTLRKNWRAKKHLNIFGIHIHSTNKRFWSWNSFNGH